MTDLRAAGLNELRQEMTNTYNRLHSIDQDSNFVSRVAHSGNLPVIPNLRCGAWYVDPSLIPSNGAAFAYFKSTDGHTSQWNFNLRRANLHLLPLIIAHGGIILIDSTRRGKRHPDALSRTVPIWCAVINRVLGLEGEHSGLFTPPDSVSPSEHAQMEDGISKWAELLNASEYTLPALTKPLRPFWISPDSSNPRPPTVDDSSHFYAIVCLSASQRVQDGVDRRLGFIYVQGSGDDHEMWSKGLTPDLFWRHKDKLLACDQTDLEDEITQILEDTRNSEGIALLNPIRPVHGRILVGTRAANHPMYLGDLDTCAMLILTSNVSDVQQPENSTPTTLSVRSFYPKQHPTEFLTHTLPISLEFIRTHLELPGSRVCILCKDAKDLSVGIATAAITLYFNEAGYFVRDINRLVTKDMAKRRLQWVLSSCPGANPSRATLKRVNEYLMSPLRPSLLGKPAVVSPK
ncbi:tRNA A64-2'-O-ribosylphosphate transferase OS=Saccharomyces cerevisiae (strain ATCC 204508 / S288c) GN=RIT1 PE=1 SV=3 [Rhizoctonia solani AG-1 IB]|uniref:tRNA A64-2'-O-ribosylphosphate transferase n=1 Tax=Thanatephorus cucumeris (strain AG1-IB / isolate 7/3/14) TaxID=1108050 RepID=A0A0B7FLT8_THACB|nr:tRNA A64-2'-O-ribosylphosphate transferase OS=Saccharomyces cerevisiae (strain ATCC 204508 / S288c) GN=RIT1 PE=1 SV=3 [Rhizoctonia solani AG-1 IB]